MLWKEICKLNLRERAKITDYRKCDTPKKEKLNVILMTYIVLNADALHQKKERGGYAQ